MKILFWTDGFWPRLGGIETHGYELIRELQRRGHEFRVIAQKDKGEWKESEIYEGIQIERFDFNAILSKKELSAIAKVKEHLGKFEPDLIHLNACNGGSAFAFLLFLEQLSAPKVLTAHTAYLYGGAPLPAVKKIVSSMDRIGCVSKWVLREMQTHFPSEKEKLSLIYNGLPMPKTAPLPLPFSPPTLLLFGRLCKEKGFDYGIRAFAHLKQNGSEACLIVAGGGPERANLENLVQELAISECVTFTGVLSPSELRSTFNRSTLVIVPSIIESFGLVILEAMQMGRPCVASNVEGIPEIVLQGKTGLLVEPRNPLALCDAIARVLKDPQEAALMGKAAWQRAFQFGIEDNATGFENLYRELL